MKYLGVHRAEVNFVGVNLGDFCSEKTGGLGLLFRTFLWGHENTIKYGRKH